MADDLKLHRDIIASIDGDSLRSQITKLAKIAACSEDDQLKRRIGHLLPCLKRGHPLDPTTSRNLVQLREYCEDVIGRQKPQWQILAERHGWSPPKLTT